MQLKEFLIKPYSIDKDSLYIKVYAESLEVLLAKAEKGDVIIPIDYIINVDETKKIEVK